MTDKSCRDCEKRTVWYDENGIIHTCHQNCPVYSRQKAARDEMMKRIRQETENNIIIAEGIDRAKKRRC